MAGRLGEVISGALGLCLVSAGQGARLPPERELAASLGTSRPTLRQALAQLSGWGIVEARGGSGVRVVDRAAWSVGALPALLAIEGLGHDAQHWLRSVATDALALRRQLARQVPTLLGLGGPGDDGSARRAVREAWERRGEPGAFVRADAAVLRHVLVAAGALGAAWTWNDLSAAAAALADRGPEPLDVDADYVAGQDEALDALARGDGRTASRVLGTHFARLDRQLLHALGAAAL